MQLRNVNLINLDVLHLAFFQIQGLEKYVMTKLFTRVFASLPDDVKVDEQLSEKMSLIQQFIRPENLDIKPTFQNETSWLVSCRIHILSDVDILDKV